MGHVLITHKGWENFLSFQGLLRVDENELVKQRETNFKTILRTFNHMYMVDDIFKLILKGAPPLHI